VAEETFWALVRDQFPLDRDLTYLNTGGLGPAPYPVVDAVTKTIWELQKISEHEHGRINDARPVVAAFLGADPEEIAFTRNATEANATVASGLQLAPGDEVIFESHAHPGGYIPWMSRQKRDGIKCVLFEPDPEGAEGNLERIAAEITSRTRVIQISHVTAPTGIRLPANEIAELARERGVWFHVDGAQSPGMIPVNVHEIGCDSFGTSFHKWTLAPHGTGALYVRRDRLDEVFPTDVGAYSNADLELPDAMEYVDTAVRYEPGTRDAATIVGTQKAIEFMTAIGLDRVAAYGQGLARYLQDGLRQIDGVTVLTPTDPTLSGSITTFKTEQRDYQDVARELYQTHKLRCRVVSEVGLNAVRVSTHVFNNRDECDRVVAAVRELVV
jgi:selenocysteine lyase/cysteine desulfurase